MAAMSGSLSRVDAELIHAGRFTAVLPAWGEAELRGDRVERQGFVGQAGPGHEPGHAPDDAGRFILGEHPAAGGANPLAPEQSVLPIPVSTTARVAAP